MAGAVRQELKRPIIYGIDDLLPGLSGKGCPSAILAKIQGEKEEGKAYKKAAQRQAFESKQTVLMSESEGGSPLRSSVAARRGRREMTEARGAVGTARFLLVLTD